MSCVSKTVRQLQQFQDLAKKHDIHADLLEQIMYEWINTEGNENTFPSDAFIESHIKGTPMTNASQEQIELWNKRYGKPITFNTFSEAQYYQRFLTRYFSKESISLVPTYAGKYKVSVEKPVKEGVYQEHDRTGGQRDTNLKSLIQKDSVTVEDLLSIVSNSEYAGIVEFLRTKKNLFKGVEVHIDDWRGGRSALYNGRRAYYNADTNTIFINGDASFVNNDSSSVILHEIMHSVTLARLHSDADAMKRFQAIMDEYIAKLPFSEGMYYNKNAGVLKYDNALEEFVADIWSNKSVIDNLKSIKSDSNTTLWDKIKAFFKGLIFGDVAGDSLMAKASIELDKLLDTTPSNVRVRGNYYELHITPAKPVDAKAAVKGKYATKFIGFADGISGSSTAEYARQAGKFANVGHYTPVDIIFVSIPGRRGNEELRHQQQDRTIAEAVKAIESGALLLTDNAEYVKNSTYNEGERRLAEELRSRGYIYNEREVDGHLIGYWTHPNISEMRSKFHEKVRNWYWNKIGWYENLIDKLKDKVQWKRATAQDFVDIDKYEKILSTNMHLYKMIEEGDAYWEEGQYGLTVVPIQRASQQEDTQVYEEAYSKMEAESIVDDLVAFEGYSRDDITVNFVKSDSEEIDDFYEIRIKKSALHQEEVKSQESVEEILVEQAEETETDEPLSKEDQEFLDSQVSFNNQLSTLLNNDLGVTQTDIMKFAESVGYTMSDYLTWCQEGKMIGNEFHKDYIFEVFPHLRNTPEERAKIQNMSRQQLAQYIGVQNLINVVKKALSEEGRDYSFDQLEAIYMFTDNWGAIMNLASMVFNNNEDFSILLKDGITSETLESTSIDIDNYNESNNEDEVFENEGSQQEHWQVKSRTIDIVSSIPQRVKGVLQQCKILDNDGNVVYNTWGHEERINLRNATKSILHWTEGSLNITDMIRKLEEQQDDNPWISQVLTLLNDTSGKYADFQSLFYSTFRKVSQKYSSVIRERGKMQNKNLNTDPALKRVTRGIRDLFRIGQHPLFKQNGIDGRNFNELKRESASLKSSLEDGNMVEANRALTRIINFLAGSSDIASMITADIEKTITKEDAKSMLEKVEHIIKTIEPKLNEASYDPFNFNDRSSISGDLNKLLKPLVKKLEETAVDSFYSDGNMYQTRVLPSWLTVFVETVNNPQAFNELMQKEYGITEWFRDQTQDFDNLDSWRSSWLRILNGRGITPEMRDRLFQHHVQLSYDGKQYMRDMNDMEYALSLISEYFSFKGSSDEMMQIANYVLPMMSNKPSNEFISFVRYSGDFSGSGVSWYDSAVQPSENTVIIDQSNTKLDGTDLFSDNNKRIAWSIVKEADRNKGRKYRIGNITEGTKFTTSDVIRLFDSMKGFTNNVIPANILFNIDDILQTASPAKAEIVEGLKLTFDQEILRIQTVYDRHKLFGKKSQYWIKGWDDNGTKFNFLPELNDYLTEEFTGTNGSKRNTDFGKLLQKVLKGDKALTAEEKLRFNDRAKALILMNMDRLASQQVEEWKRNGIFQACERVSNLSDNVVQRENQLKEMFWNHRLAEINLLQLTIIDKAFYKNEEDLQKRMAQIHAPGVKGNKFATDYGNSDAYISDGNQKGIRRVSDGYCRNIVLTDFEGIKSNIVMNVREVFDRKLKAMQEGTAQYIAASEAYNAIVKSFEENINVADAQAYSALTATRKKKLIFGKWDRHYEDVFNRIQNGTYTYDDLNFAIQPEKPFLYGHTMESTRVESQISKMPIPVQNKNSEYLIVLADAILQNEKTGRPNMLKVLNRIMEESAWTGRTYNPDGTIKTKGTYNGKGIDVVQFESAVKSGLEGKIDLRPFMESQNGEQEAYDYIRGMIYQSTDKGVLIDRPEGYNDASVKALDFDSYSIQQEVPEHFLNHEQSHGSQERVIIPSDLENFDSEGNEVFYTYKDNGKVVSQKAKEFRKEYEEAISKNIQYSINDLRQQLGLAIDGKSKGRKQKNIALAKLLQREILSNISRYGVDLLQSCMLDENGEFVIPLGDPIQGKRVEQLINSIIKNRVNKQVVSGGPVVQVSNWGTSRELSIVFKDKKGGLLQTYKQYMESHEGATDEQYKAYVQENQGGMAYMEVFAPIFDERLLEFADEKGNIDISKIEAMNPEILEMIGYRIPTEDKYSIIPMKIVGFLPREAGAGIMMANDVTLLTGSDFDVDKMFLMRKSFDWKDNTDQIRTKVLDVAFAEMKEGSSMKQISDMVDQFLTNPEAMKDMDELHRKMYNAYKAERKISGVIMPKSGKQYLNNKVFNMSYSVLTNETTLDKMLNPGGFDRQKVMGYKIEAFRISGKSWEELSKMSWKELQKTVQTPKDLSLIGTQIQFYKQNSAAATALGMAAVQKSAHALLEGDGYKINVSKVCNLVRTPSAEELREIGYDVDDVEYNRMVELIGEGKMSEKELIQKFGDLYQWYKEGVDGQFAIAGKVFSGLMEFDAKYDDTGVTMIGRTLGELVAMFADAVKDPVANLMNVNNTTMPVFTTLIRFGMSFEDAALFMSQKVIKDMLSELGAINAGGRKKGKKREKKTTFERLLANEVKKLRTMLSISQDSRLNYEELTRQELIDGIKESKPTVIYKVMNNYLRIAQMNKAIKGATFLTRFNSMSGAVGPLIIDNLMMEYKMNSQDNDLIDANGNVVPTHTILDKHPIINGFSQSLYISQELFKGMPIASQYFKHSIDSQPELMRNKIMSSRSLLNSYARFFNSYLMVSSGIINPNSDRGLEYFITKFPQEFFASDPKTKYPDNPFIQAMRLSAEENGNNSVRQVIRIDHTGLDEVEKSKLRSGWADLQKKDPQLAFDLFQYAFYKGGIDFNPKSFMALLPVQLRKMYYQYANGTKMVFRDFERTDEQLIFNQFLRNNSDDYSLFPSPQDIAMVEVGNGVFKVLNADKIGFENTPSFAHNNKLYIFAGTQNGTPYYREYTALGNNGEYMEMSLNPIESAMNDNPLTTFEQQSDVKDLEEQDEPLTTSEKIQALNAATQWYNTVEGKQAVDTQSSREQKMREFEKHLAEEGIKFDKGVIEGTLIKLNIC